MAFGVSFVPGGQNGEGRSERNGAPDSRYQQAIKILSLRLPKLRGASGGLAPAPLLQAGGAMGQPTAAMGGTQPLTSEIARAFLQMAGLTGGLPGGGQRPMGGRMAATMAPRTPQAPPRVIPGIDQLPGGAPEVPAVTREWAPPPEEPISQYQIPQTIPQEFPTFGGGADVIESDDGLDYFDQLRRRIAGGGGY